MHLKYKILNCEIDTKSKIKSKKFLQLTLDTTVCTSYWPVLYFHSHFTHTVFGHYLIELLIPGKFISLPGISRDSFGTRSGFHPIGLPNVLVVWPPTVSPICLSFALLLRNHHPRSVCSLSANSTVVSSPPQAPLPSHKPEHMRVGGHQGRWDMESWGWERLTGDRRHPRHPVWRVSGYAFIYWVKRD